MRLVPLSGSQPRAACGEAPGGKAVVVKDKCKPLVLLVGPTPPPWFGQAVGMQILLDAVHLNQSYTLVHLNINNVDKPLVCKVLATVSFLLRYLWKLLVHNPDALYLLVSRSRMGCIKDCIVMGLARLRRVPVVVHLHGGDLAVFYRGLGPLWQRLLRSFYCHVTVAIVLGESLRSQFDGLLPAERVCVVHNCWLDDDRTYSFNRQERPDSQPLNVLFLSNVLPSKGLFDALEGVAYAVSRGVKLQFQFAGRFLDVDGALSKLPGFAHQNLRACELEKTYERLIADLEIHKHVSRLGGVFGRYKWALLAKTDIVLLPIYNPTEGQPLVVIEAMRAGCAIISTQCGGLVDIVEDGITGKVVPPRSPVAIGEAIKWFWEHPGELGRIGENNMRRAAALHSPEEHVRRIREIFGEVLSGSDRRVHVSPASTVP